MILPVVAAIAFMAGCSTQYAHPGIVITDSSGRGHAECPVCKCDADLACVDVTVDGRTPRTTYAGQDYYFCSEECREKFRADPTHYTPK